MAQWMILMFENDGAWERLSGEEREALMRRYFAWVDRLRSEGRFLGGDPLAKGGRVLRVAGGAVVDGPYTETREVLTGYFRIEAPDEDAAAAIARECPALGHGERVIVRRIVDPGAAEHMEAR